MQTPQGLEVHVDNLGQVGFLFRYRDAQILVKPEEGGYSLQGAPKKEGYTFIGFSEAQEAVLQIFDQLFPSKKDTKKRSAKKKAAKKSPK